MFILAHLLAGVLIGILLYIVFPDRLVIFFAALGSVLPDIIDKPLGHIILGGSINYGRIYAHTLLFAALILIIGLIITLRHPRAGPLTLALVAGILSHQVLDFMVIEQVNWYWPFLGPFRGFTRAGYLGSVFWGEITNPGEWLSGLLLVVIGVLIFRFPDRLAEIRSGFPSRATLFVTLLFCSIFVFGLVILAGGGPG